MSAPQKVWTVLLLYRAGFSYAPDNANIVFCPHHFSFLFMTCVYEFVMVHIGSKIKEKLQEQGRTIVWFSNQINCDRTNVYDIFKRPNIDCELLFVISKVLNFNFFSYYTDNL